MCDQINIFHKKKRWMVVLSQLVEWSPPTRDARFESSHQQTFIEHLFTVNCERPGMAHKEKMY